MLSLFSHVQLFVTPWTIACQAPLSMGFSGQEYWSGLSCPPPGDLPDPGMEPMSLCVSCIGRWVLYHECQLGSPVGARPVQKNPLKRIQMSNSERSFNLNDCSRDGKMYMDFIYVSHTVKNLLQCRRHRFNPWAGKMLWRIERLPTPVFLPGEFKGQRNLVGHSPWGHKEPSTTE